MYKDPVGEIELDKKDSSVTHESVINSDSLVINNIQVPPAIDKDDEELGIEDIVKKYIPEVNMEASEEDTWNPSTDYRHVMPYWVESNIKIGDRLKEIYEEDEDNSKPLLVMDLMGGNGATLEQLYRKEVFPKDATFIGIDLPTAKENFLGRFEGLNKAFVSLNLNNADSLEDVKDLIERLSNQYNVRLLCINGITYLDEDVQVRMIELFSKYPKSAIVSLVGEHNPMTLMKSFGLKGIYENMFGCAFEVARESYRTEIRHTKNTKESILAERIINGPNTPELFFRGFKILMKTFSMMGRSGSKTKTLSLDRIEAASPKSKIVPLDQTCKDDVYIISF